MLFISEQKDSVEESSAVRKVVKDIVDYVIRKEEFLTLDIPYDSDYIPYRAEHPRKGYACARRYCLKGCVCASLNQKVITKHCKKEDCIFHCICDRRLVYSLRNLPHRRTVKIMSRSPDDSQKAEREKQLCIETVHSMQEIPFIDLSMDDTPEIPTIEILDDDTEETAELNINNQGNIPRKKGSLFAIESEKSLAEVVIKRNLVDFRGIFVWCPMHGCYICSCLGQIFDLQNNLLQNPKGEEDPQKASVHHFFNLENHCSRTVGSIFNYRLRNVSPIFALKRDFEIRKGVLSNSNSRFKIDPDKSQPELPSESNLRSEPNQPENICTKRSSNRDKTKESNNIQYCESLPVEATTVAPQSPVEQKIQLIFHDNSDSSEEEAEDTSSLPKFGLLCLNGYGYLPIKEYNSTKLVFQHPVIKNIFVSKKDQDEANLWLNDLLRCFVSSDPQHIKHQWVVVQRGILKISKPFSLKNLKADTQPVN